jgi:hypothetical protein
MKAIRFPYNRVEPGQSATSELAYLPITVNFFMEFDVCFFRSQAVFEVKPKTSRK